MIDKLRKFSLLRRAKAIHRTSLQFTSLEDDELRARIHGVSANVYLGKPEKSIVDECFALVAEASSRILGKRHFPVQIMGGLALLKQGVIEMQTGEGKTITAVLPVVLRAFRRQGCHVVTSNDYLAQRDADELRPLYELCGLSVGCITPELDGESRKKAYHCDITYGTGSEFGFDFLRDRMTLGPGVPDRNTVRSNEVMQRSHYFALVDEADSVLIDDARTPLIIGAEGVVDDRLKETLAWASRVSKRLQPDIDFSFEEKTKHAWLTKDGERSIALAEKPACLDGVATDSLLERIENALTARLAYIRNRDYVIEDGEVVIVSESSGRSMAGRKWQRGLHQAVEAKEGVEVTGESGVASRITIQSYFRKYQMLAGMTGTAASARSEFRSFFRVKVVPIPTNRPCRRQNLGVRVFLDRDSKLDAIVETSTRIAALGRSVLIGVPTVEESFTLERKFNDAGINCPVLNAVNHAMEAEIISDAGTSGKITISTNMAGRGTDILLEDGTRHAGGLHVILTELHTSVRFDRQLIGRAARQADPGSFEFLVSLDDSLFVSFAPRLQQRLQNRYFLSRNGELSPRLIRHFRNTQNKVEKRFRKERKDAFKREEKLTQTVGRTGLDPYLELLD